MKSMDALARSISASNAFRNAAPLLSTRGREPDSTGAVSMSDSVRRNSGVWAGATGAVVRRSCGPFPNGRKSAISTVASVTTPNPASAAFQVRNGAVIAPARRLRFFRRAEEWARFSRWLLGLVVRRRGDKAQIERMPLLNAGQDVPFR